jgi:hypothetical protein
MSRNAVRPLQPRENLPARHCSFARRAASAQAAFPPRPLPRPAVGAREEAVPETVTGGLRTKRGLTAVGRATVLLYTCYSASVVHRAWSTASIRGIRPMARRTS